MMDIEEELFGPLDIVEVAMNHDNNELRKMIQKKWGKYNVTEDKINMQVLKHNIIENQGWPQNRQYKYEVIHRK